MLKIMILTLLAYWSVGCIIAVIAERIPGIDSDDILMYWGCGLVFPILWVLFYPIRAWNSYSSSKNYFQGHGISRCQYILGRRV